MKYITVYNLPFNSNCRILAAELNCSFTYIFIFFRNQSRAFFSDSDSTAVLKFGSDSDLDSSQNLRLRATPTPTPQSWTGGRTPNGDVAEEDNPSKRWRPQLVCGQGHTNRRSEWKVRTSEATNEAGEDLLQCCEANNN